MDAEKIMNRLSEEIMATLKAMEKAKTAKEKLMYSKAVKNLSLSLEVFQDPLGDIGLFPGDDSIPF
ncbi:MAG: hypothetical protein QM496_12335 [Verrucomicrobiota bacterium]